MVLSALCLGGIKFLIGHAFQLTLVARLDPFVTDGGHLDYATDEFAGTNKGASEIEVIAASADPSAAAVAVVDGRLTDLLFAFHAAPQAKGHARISLPLAPGG